MKHELLKLKYDLDALAPYISKHTMELHWGKHLQAYVNNLNSLIIGTKFENAPLEQIVRESDGSIFNNAGQVWAHNFYFDSFSFKPQKTPEGPLAAAINKQFGSLEAFKEQFNKEALSLFGSGWTWLIKEAEDTLAIIKEQNAGNPIRSATGKALLCVDVWEHAYYIDYQNRRTEYLSAFWEVIDWAVAEKRY